MAEIEEIRVYPVKGLDGTTLERTQITDGGTLAYDREFALFADGKIRNAKHSEKFHSLDTEFDPESSTLEIETDDGEFRSFELDDSRQQDRAQQWFSEFFGIDLTLRRNTELGYVDRRNMGPSVISTATLETVASWFDEMTVEGARRRLRANVEISGVEPFWEDRFVGPDAPGFETETVRFEGVTPCGRCVVPQRDPDTGEPIEQFREQFVENRRETFPDWADRDAFDHLYTVMIITRIPDGYRTGALAVGDIVTVVN